MIIHSTVIKIYSDKAIKENSEDSEKESKNGLNPLEIAKNI